MMLKPWLLSDTSPGGFCNQLFGVFSAIPVAKLLNANVIVGPIFSRRSFTAVYGKFTETMVRLPYSAFFDFKHFQNFWYLRGVKVVQKIDVKECMNMSAVIPLRKPRFFSYSDAQIMGIVRENHTLPLHRGVGVQFIEHHSMTAMYNNLQNGRELLQGHTYNRHLQQLGDTYLSLIPNSKMK